jgi:putative transcriptional regulator
MIRYDKLKGIMEARGFNTTSIRTDKVIGQGTWSGIIANKHIDTCTIEKICRWLQCQPGDWIDFYNEDGTMPSFVESVKPKKKSAPKKRKVADKPDEPTKPD